MTPPPNLALRPEARTGVPGPRPASPHLAAVIVNYRSADESIQCTESLIDHGVIPPQCMVVLDNCSPDSSYAALQRHFGSRIRLHRNPRNGGFGAGVNAAISKVRADFYLVLNPDTYVEDSRILAALRLFSEHPRLGILGLNLRYPDGQPQWSARRFYSLLTVLLRRTPFGNLPFMRRWLHEHLMVDAWRQPFFQADWVMGTGMIIRREAFEAIGGMDERYFLYMEDVDLCKRMWQAGWQVGATSTVTVFHRHGRASRNPFSSAGWHHLRSFVRYYRKFGMPLWGHGDR